MKKSGFTMIELIFVIVIIGILAAVAVPKLAATRTDAKIAVTAKQIKKASDEVRSYITSQGGEVNGTALTSESKVLSDLITKGKAIKNSDTNITIYGDEDKDGNYIGCVTLKTNDTILFVETNSSAKGQVCTGVKNLINDANYQVAGTKVKF